MIVSLAVFLILFLTALLIGNQALRFFHCRFRDGEEELVFSYGLGVLFLSWTVLALGIAGRLEARFLWVAIMVLAAAGSFRIRHILGLPRTSESRWLRRIFWLVAVFIGVGAMTPLYGSDTLAYHLSCSKAFLNMKRVDLVLDDMNSLFPLFTEMLFTLGLALRNETVAQLFHWSLGVLLAFSLTSFFDRFFGSKKWGRIAALFFLLTPGIFNEMRTALVDVAWAAYGFLSFYALGVGMAEKHKGWLWLSFLFLGVTLGIKYLAALSVLSTFCVFLVLAFQSAWKPMSVLRWTLAMGLGVVLISGYWYLKAYRVYGNPVYPYFNSWFGLEPLRIGLQSPGEYGHKAGMGRSLWSLLSLPFRLTFFPTRFDGWAEQLGPAYLVFLPFVFLGPRTQTRLALELYATVFTLGWFWLAQVTRFFYPALPFLTLLILSGLYCYDEAERKRPSFCSRILLLILLLNGAILVYHSREGLAYLVGLEPKAVFLEKRERSYHIAKFVNENTPPDAKILNFEEPRMFYFNRTLVRESAYRFRTRYDQTNDRGEIFERLKRDGFTHLLVANEVSRKRGKAGGGWIDHDSQDRRLDRVYQTHFRERNGREMEYTLYRLR